MQTCETSVRDLKENTGTMLASLAQRTEIAEKQSEAAKKDVLFCVREMREKMQALTERVESSEKHGTRTRRR